MVRPIKEGLDYASLDCDYFMDPKLMRVEEEFGSYSRLIYIDIILYAKAEHGYWALFDDDSMRVFCRGRGHNATKTQKVVAALVNAGLFDKDIWAQHQVLTCTRMQNEYAVIKRKNKAKLVIKYPEFTLAQTVLSTVQTDINTEQTVLSTAQSTQSKVKESKENTPPTPSQKTARGKVRDFIGQECVDELSELYGHESIEALIDELQDYVLMNGKTYYDYEVTLRSWAKRKLKPIPVWEHCDNPACHHGLVFTTNDKGESIAVPCPSCEERKTTQ